MQIRNKKTWGWSILLCSRSVYRRIRYTCIHLATKGIRKHSFQVTGLRCVLQGHQAFENMRQKNSADRSFLQWCGLRWALFPLSVLSDCQVSRAASQNRRLWPEWTCTGWCRRKGSRKDCLMKNTTNCLRNAHHVKRYPSLLQATATLCDSFSYQVKATNQGPSMPEIVCHHVHSTEVRPFCKIGKLGGKLWKWYNF